MLGHNDFLKHAKIGHLIKLIKRQSTADTDEKCRSGGLYVLPARDAIIDSAVKTQISWDLECLKDNSASKVDRIDIYLYGPSRTNATLPIHAWTGVKADQKELDVKLAPYWWISDPKQSSSASLSVNIVKAGNEPWDSANPMGPSWQATYTVPADGRIPDDAVKEVGKVEKVITAFFNKGELTAAGKTAAIVCPIVVVVVILGLFIRKLHINRNNKTVDWADQMDKRMSRISADWTAGGDGSAGPTPGTRPASYMSRPSHDIGDMAGRGAGARVPRHMADVAPAYATDGEMSEARPRGMSMYDEGNRTSRISFAGDTRGDRISRISYANSSEAHSTRGMGAHTTGHKSSASLPRVGQNGFRRSQMATDSYYDPDAPAVPQLNERYRSSYDTRCESRFSDGLVYADEDEDDEILMSPTQNDGPMPLGSRDVERMHNSLEAERVLASNGSPTRKQMGHADEEHDNQLRNSMLQYPALSMVSSGREGKDGQTMFASNDDQPASALTDDSYIEHHHYQSEGQQAQLTRSAGVNTQTGMAPPFNYASPDEAMRNYASLRNAASSPPSNTMRSLYTPDDLPRHQTQSSVGGSSLNEDDVVGYNEMIDHGNSR